MNLTPLHPSYYHRYVSGSKTWDPDWFSAKFTFLQASISPERKRSPCLQSWSRKQLSLPFLSVSWLMRVPLHMGLKGVSWSIKAFMTQLQKPKGTWLGYLPPPDPVINGKGKAALWFCLPMHYLRCLSAVKATHFRESRNCQKVLWAVSNPRDKIQVWNRE